MRGGFADWWYASSFAYYERLNSVLYEGRNVLPIVNAYHTAPEDIEVGLPTFDCSGALLYFANPFIIMDAFPLTVEAMGDVFADIVNRRSKDYTYFSRKYLPDNTDISTAFYRGRSFIRLLEVDNPLVLPYGTNIKLSITADDVIHS